MSKREIVVPEEIVEELKESFYDGPMLNERGIRSLNEEQVDRVHKMVIKIWPDEHPPPHFHVQFAGEDASFLIADGNRLPNTKGLEKFDHNITKWWKSNMCKLINVWNATRPTDCQVGPIAVPPECAPKKKP